LAGAKRDRFSLLPLSTRAGSHDFVYGFASEFNATDMSL
jgi:hypothetical protein